MAAHASVVGHQVKEAWESLVRTYIIWQRKRLPALICEYLPGCMLELTLLTFFRLTLHNVHYLLALMKSARTAIIKDQYPQFIKDFFAKIYGSNSCKFPAWAVTALRKVNVDLLAV